MAVTKTVYCLKYEHPIDWIRQIQESNLFTEIQKTDAIYRFLDEEQQSNKLFASVLSGDTTFEKYVQEYVDDNLGMGLFKRWKLNKKPSSEFIENISGLFNTNVYRTSGAGRLGLSITENLAESDVVTPLTFSSVVCSIGATILLSIELSSAVHHFVLMFGIMMLYGGSYMSIVDLFYERKNMAQRILNTAKKLDEIVQEYWKPKNNVH